MRKRKDRSNTPEYEENYDRIRWDSDKIELEKSKAINAAWRRKLRENTRTVDDVLSKQSYLSYHHVKGGGVPAKTYTGLDE